VPSKQAQCAETGGEEGGDRRFILIWKTKPTRLASKKIVSNDGTVTLPLCNSLTAHGIGPSALTRAITGFTLSIKQPLVRLLLYAVLGGREVGVLA
jgi:hypothetical protein